MDTETAANGDLGRAAANVDPRRIVAVGDARGDVAVGEPRGTTMVEWVIVVIGVLAGVIAALGLLLAAPDQDLVLLGLTLVVTIGLGFVALYRFEWFVLAVLTIRPSLDDLKSDALDPLQPSAILGLLVIGLVVVRALVDRMQGVRVFPTPMSKAYALCALFLSLSYVTSLNRAETLPAMLGFVSSACLYLGMERLLRNDQASLGRLLAAVGLGVIIPVATGIIQYGWTGIVEPVSGLLRLDGSFTHYNPYATYLVIVLLLLLSSISAVKPTQRILIALVAAPTFFVLLQTYARAAWISLTLGVLLFTWRLDKRVTLIVVFLVVAVAALTPGVADRLANITSETSSDGGAKTDDSLAWRFSYWGEVAPLFWRNPLNGVGLQVVPELTVRGARPHNSFLQAAVEAGILGLAGWLLLVGTAILGCVKAWRLAGDRTTMTAFQRALLLGSVAAISSTVLQLLTENILTDTVLQWHLNLALAHVAVMVWWRKRDAAPSEAEMIDLGDRPRSESGSRVGVDV